VCVAAKYKAVIINPNKLEYCIGDCTTKEEQVFIAQEFIAVLNSSSAYSTHCQTFTGCGVTNFSLQCSQVTRRKRDTRSVNRNCTHNAQITFALFIKVRDEELLDADKRWAEIQDTLSKMREYIRQSIDNGQLDLTVTDSFEIVYFRPHFQCPPGSLPSNETLTCRMSITTQHSDNALFPTVFGSVLLS